MRKNPLLTFCILNRITTNLPTTDTARVHFQTLLFFRNNNCIHYVISTVTLRPFLSTAFFHLPYFSITSFNDFSHKTRSFAYNNSINEPSPTFSIRTSITIIKKSGLKADPWWTSTCTENELDTSASTETGVLQPF